MLALIMAISDPIKRDLLLDLVGNYQERCLAFAFSIINNHHTAEDVVQNVFEKLVKDPDMLKYDTVRENWPYIIIIIRNASLNCLRGEKRNVLVDDFDNNTEGVPPITYDVDFSELLATQERFISVINAIMALPDIYKDVILLRYGNNLSSNEISDYLGISIDNYYQRISRALKKLEEEFKLQDEGDKNGN